MKSKVSGPSFKSIPKTLFKRQKPMIQHENLWGGHGKAPWTEEPAKSRPWLWEQAQKTELLLSDKKHAIQKASSTWVQTRRVGPYFIKYQFNSKINKTREKKDMWTNCLDFNQSSSQIQKQTYTSYKSSICNHLNTLVLNYFSELGSMRGTWGWGWGRRPKTKR